MFKGAQQCHTRSKTVQSAHFDKALKRAFANNAQINATDKVIDVIKGASSTTLNDGFNGSLTNVFDSAKTKTDGGFFAFLVFNSEVKIAGVDVGGQNCHAH